MKKFLVGGLAIAMIGGLLFMNPVSAASSHVVFVGGAEDFVFYNDDDGDEDLFDGLHDVMAKDERTETITVRNSASDYDYVKIYLQSVTIPDGVANEAGDVTNAEFLANFILDIRRGEEIIYSGTAENLDTFVANVDLGTYYPGDEDVITVTLAAAENLSNRFMHCAAAVNWSFLVEAYKDGKVVPYSPDTGFMTGSGAAVGVMSVASVVMIGGVWGLVKLRTKTGRK